MLQCLSNKLAASTQTCYSFVTCCQSSSPTTDCTQKMDIAFGSEQRNVRSEHAFFLMACRGQFMLNWIYLATVSCWHLWTQWTKRTGICLSLKDVPLCLERMIMIMKLSHLKHINSTPLYMLSLQMWEINSLMCVSVWPTAVVLMCFLCLDNTVRIVEGV